MVFSNPSGKQNSFAGNVYPGLVCVEHKEKKIPISYVNAFEIPVRGNYGRGLTKQSAELLVQEIDKFDRKFMIEGTERLWFAHTECSKPKNAIEIESLDELIKRCNAWITK
jgi:CRISPR system Cascade subunit CasC